MAIARAGFGAVCDCDERETARQEKTLAAMWASQKAKDGGKTTVEHGGVQAGSSTYLLVLREQGVAVAVLCNLQGAMVEKLAGEVAGRMIED